MSYANDIIISRSVPSAKEIYSDMKSASRTIALQRNANETNLIIQTHWPREKDQNVTIDGDIIVVEDFACLGSNIHKSGDKFHEITSRINLVNKTCFSLLHLFKSKCVHKMDWGSWGGFQDDIGHKILER